MAEGNRVLLVVEDDPGLQKQLRWAMEGCRVVVAGDKPGALDLLARENPAVVTLDLGLPPEPGGPTIGFATLEAILAARPATKVIVVTGNDERENAVRAIGMGAYDFCSKPVDGDLLRLIVDRAFRLYELEEENRRLREGRHLAKLPGILTSSPSMIHVCRMIDKAAPTEVAVLLLGESGTGKELLARALHSQGRRAGGPFVAINCAAIPENLLESELFGFEKGAFTGAIKQTPGRVELADGGTLFLDEIGDLPKQLQVKLLRFLQERVIERVGGRKSLPVDVRIIAATNQDLQEQIRGGSFREDLYYRLSQFVIDIPPLRARDDDAVLLAHAFLRQYGDEQKKSSLRGFAADAIAAIAAYNWPGNVRELENRVQRAVILADGPQVTAVDLDLEPPAGAEAGIPTLRAVRDQAEQVAVLRAMAAAGGNMSMAARLLGVSRPKLYDLMKQHGIQTDRSAGEAEPADQDTPG
jgi:two-component system NtrC family response regulator